MNNEYIIINKENFQKTIEELHNTCVEFGFPTSAFDADLKEILSTQSTPLTPIIEEAFQQGVLFNQNPLENINLKKYILNLKLNNEN